MTFRTSTPAYSSFATRVSGEAMPLAVQNYLATMQNVRADEPTNHSDIRTIGRSGDTFYAADADGKLYQKGKAHTYKQIDGPLMFRNATNGHISVFDGKGMESFDWNKHKNLPEIQKLLSDPNAAAKAPPPATVVRAKEGKSPLDDEKPNVQNLGMGSLAGKRAITAEVTNIINQALKDKTLANMVDGLKNGTGNRDEFLARLSNRMTEAGNEKYGADHANTSFIKAAMGDTLGEISQKGAVYIAMNVPGYFNKSGDHYQLSPEGVKGLSEPMADKITKRTQPEPAVSAPKP